MFAKTLIMKLFIASIIFVSTIFLTKGQIAQELDNQALVRHEINKKGMYILGTWAVANIAGGVAISTQTQGVDKYFHQMNALWNTINLSIAVPALFKKYRSPQSLTKNIKQQNSVEKAFLLNTGLDLAYIAGGGYLNALSQTENDPMLQGIGNSVMLQGAALFIFDFTLYLAHKNNAKGIYKHLDKISFYNGRLGVNILF